MRSWRPDGGRGWDTRTLGRCGCFGKRVVGGVISCFVVQFETPQGATTSGGGQASTECGNAGTEGAPCVVVLGRDREVGEALGRGRGSTRGVLASARGSECQLVPVRHQSSVVVRAGRAWRHWSIRSVRQAPLGAMRAGISAVLAQWCHARQPF
ncbi:uncharacterized protein CANTADRAFT_191104 [Suhomyces tanzawaensis NRRL Y-17324]|uniref:Uncharacterized protein n=1 Tax=Suhomyces tanzawaensis NRRL Y-17324 TaxID=984487 RepID=A0A1E4SNT4_9ASCO|nr:uncharacterized protein CANTADRAFT_191104 [Suhomyces tanzawaensis NRRL Y-17324]ODV81148.1 hypothetical protein CANTADRAFT_191104 [Suhomyces tanzawaensis NRRL Y-17324]